MKADNFRWLGPYKPTDRHADDVTVSELVRLRAENDRYREQLEDILECGNGDDILDAIKKDVRKTLTVLKEGE